MENKWKADTEEHENDLIFRGGRGENIASSTASISVVEIFLNSKKPYEKNNTIQEQYKTSLCCFTAEALAPLSLCDIIDDNYRVITLFVKKHGNLPFCLENHELFSLPPIFITFYIHKH